MSAPDPGFGIYVHWPFCASKCPYCDFNSHVRETVDQDAWRDGLLRELDHYAAETTGRTVSSVFFGGGTPSLMPPSTVGALIERIAKHWPTADGLEITLEANPTSVEADKFKGFNAAGVNRVSLGVQALDDRALRFLGRRHSAREALDAVALARRYFGRFSFDLIYARPSQKLDAWEAELRQALEEGAEHMSVYQLTIEPNTAFYGMWRRGELKMPSDEEQVLFYELTQAVLGDAGLPAYEISNHARPGQECRHNLTYWRYGDYVGIGPGAHGRLTTAEGKVATRQHRAPEPWLERIAVNGHATRGRAPLGPRERLEEMTMMGLRLTEGVHRDAFRREAGSGPEELFDSGRLDSLMKAGLLEWSGDFLRATAEGRQRLNAVTAHLLS